MKKISPFEEMILIHCFRKTIKEIKYPMKDFISKYTGKSYFGIMKQLNGHEIVKDYLVEAMQKFLKEVNGGAISHK